MLKIQKKAREENKRTNNIDRRRINEKQDRRMPSSFVWRTEQDYRIKKAGTGD